MPSCVHRLSEKEVTKTELSFVRSLKTDQPLSIIGFVDLNTKFRWEKIHKKKLKIMWHTLHMETMRSPVKICAHPLNFKGENWF